MRLATGSGVPGRRLDLVAFQVAANLCDEQANRSAGGTEPRYHGAGVISEGDDPKQILDMLCAACAGRFRDTGGKLALVIAHNDLAAAAADDGLNDDDVIGGFTWDPDPALEATPNVVRGRYVDATSASLYQLIDYPEVRIASLDGQDRIMSLDLGVVESPSQAQRIAKQALERRQYQRSFSATFDIRAWKYTVGDPVPFTFGPLGFTRALFRVASQELGQGGSCDMTLSVEHPVIYSWDASDAPPVLAADPIIYDKGNNPLILAIGEAANTALWSAVANDDGNKPEDKATYGAPGNSPVGDRTAAQIVSDLSLNGTNALFASAFAMNKGAILDAISQLQGGSALVAQVNTLTTKITDPTQNGIQTVNLIGAAQPDGKGGTIFVINQNTALGTPDKLLGQTIDTIVQQVGGHEQSITSFKQILTAPDGSTELRGVFSMTDGNVVTGIVNTLTGGKSRFAIATDDFYITSKDGSGIAYNPFTIIDGVVTMLDVVVRKLSYEALIPLFGDQYSSLNADYGWEIMPSGKIRQWGKLRQTINSEVAFSIVWPKQFKTVCTARGGHPFVAAFNTAKDLYVQNVGEASVSGGSFQTQASTGNAQSLDGIDWWAEGY
nr:phage tail protein [Sphingomonas sp. GC_Shp_3]